jgi:hypothetical protein
MREPTGKHVAKNFGGPRIKPLHPKTILPVFPSEKSVGHPTQKPVKTMEWLVKSYSRVGDVVLDNTMGSGSTGVACANTKRAFVGIEMGDEYFHTAHDRVRSAWLNELHEELDEEPEKTLTVDDVDLARSRSRLTLRSVLSTLRSFTRDWTLLTWTTRPSRKLW